MKFSQNASETYFSKIRNLKSFKILNFKNELFENVFSNIQNLQKQTKIDFFKNKWFCFKKSEFSMF